MPALAIILVSTRGGKMAAGFFRSVMFTLLAASLGAGSGAMASDACKTKILRAKADVSVSDGMTYSIETIFRDRTHASFKQTVSGAENLTVAEGPFGWYQQEGASLGDGFHQSYALGHQFHAILFEFDSVMKDVTRVTDIPYMGSIISGLQGSNPFAGTVWLVDGDTPERPSALLFQYPDIPLISIRLEDWRDIYGVQTPYRMVIDDQSRVFTYQFTEVAYRDEMPSWFMDQLSAGNALDALAVYRLHRRLMIAHCLGDHDAIADLSTKTMTFAGGGSLETISRDAIRARFERLFKALDYTGYHDLKAPIITVSASVDIAWAGVEVQAEGLSLDSDTSLENTSFKDIRAWLMLAEKVNGRWLHAGNTALKVLETKNY